MTESEDVESSRDNESDGKLIQIKNLKTYFYTEEGIVKAVDGVSFYKEGGRNGFGWRDWLWKIRNCFIHFKFSQSAWKDY